MAYKEKDNKKTSKAGASRVRTRKAKRIARKTPVTKTKATRGRGDTGR